MDQSVRAIAVSSEFLWSDPQVAMGLLLERMGEQEADVWVVIIGPDVHAAHEFMDRAFVYGPAEDPIE